MNPAEDNIFKSLLLALKRMTHSIAMSFLDIFIDYPSGQMQTTKAFEFCTSKHVADPVEHCSVLCIENLQGEFRAFESQEAFHG